jgi:hypothetical protein
MATELNELPLESQGESSSCRDSNMLELTELLVANIVRIFEQTGV